MQSSSAGDGQVGGDPVKTPQTVESPGRATKTESSGLTLSVLDRLRATLAKMRAQDRGNQGRAEQKTLAKGAVMRVIVTWRSNETEAQDYAAARSTVDGNEQHIHREHCRGNSFGCCEARGSTGSGGPRRDPVLPLESVHARVSTALLSPAPRKSCRLHGQDTSFRTISPGVHM